MKTKQNEYIDSNLFLPNYLQKLFIAKEKGAYHVEDIYDRYRKRQIIKALSTINFKHQSILQIGLFSGDIIKSIAKSQPKELFGLGIVHELNQAILEGIEKTELSINQFNVKNLPFPDDVFDCVLVVDFLSYLDESRLAKKILWDMGRVSRRRVIIVENIHEEYLKTPFYRGRELSLFLEPFEKMGYELKIAQPINMGATHKLRQLLRANFNPPNCQLEGAALSKQAMELQKLFFPLANALEGIFSNGDGLKMLVFEKPIVEYY